jgi:serine/threonine protein kinase
MAIVFKDGEKESSGKTPYEVVRKLSEGGMAISYEAKDPVGRRVFFKQYMQPTVQVSWYKGYVAYQEEMRRRIANDPTVRGLTYQFIDFFEGRTPKHRDYFQVFEFVEGGMSLQDCLDKLKKDPKAFSWKDRVLFARVMMVGIAGLHKLDIVHTDLKPDNIYLLPNKSKPGDYYLRIIDMDFAVLHDRQAPWHGIEGYVGTPFYQSPEHVRGEVPGPGSDVFTCGSMLSLLLGGAHPFGKCSDAAAYCSAISAGKKHSPFKVEQPIPLVEDVTSFEHVLNSCFDPAPDRRPTAREVADALLGKKVERFTISLDPAKRKPKAETETKLVRPDPSETEKPGTKAIDPSGMSIWIYFGDVQQGGEIRINTPFGRDDFSKAHEDVKFLDKKQFRIYRDDKTKNWMIAHDPSAQNETLVNGKRLESPAPISDGMRVAVGKASKGIEKFPLTLRLKPKGK